MQVGRVRFTCWIRITPQNARTEDRDITDQLYGGDREMRIRQEIVLGIGGYRALKALRTGADRVSHERGPLGVSFAWSTCGT